MGRSQVSWFSKFFKKDIEYQTIQTDIPMTTIMRWYLYDTELVEPNELAEDIGLSLVSEEGDVKEKEDSNNRISEILHVIPYLETISNISANVLVSLHLKELEENNPGALEEFDAEEPGYDDEIPFHDRFWEVGGREISQAVENLLHSGFELKDIIEFIKQM
jgi:hypothetical protein